MKTLPCRSAGLSGVLFLLFALPAAPVPAQASKDTAEPAADRLIGRLQEMLDAQRERHGFPGAVVGFVLPDGREGAVATGFSDLEAKKAMTPRDRLLSGSIGKTYVSAVALQLAGEKKLDLDAGIDQWFGEEPWFPRLPNGPDITVRMLMNHTSGIPEHVRLPEFGKAVGANPDRVWKPVELLEYILDAEPLHPAGEGFAYADTNYIVLGMILEKITGRPYYDELRRRVLEPLGLKDTLPSDRREIPGLVAGYAGPQTPFEKPGRTLREGRFVVNPQAEWTGGGLAGTTLDLARWARIVYRGGAFPKELMEAFLDGVPAFGGRERYGLGVQVWSGAHGTCLGHAGWFPGYLSLMAYYRDLELALAVQFNTDEYPENLLELRKFLDGFAGLLASG
jgi:D-alanyl-D-alanine carboxypeptidase